MGGKSSAPPPPDYAAAAQATAAGNANAAQVTNYANRVNQITPQGNVTFTPNVVGHTAAGDPLTQWTQTTTLSPEQQALYNQNQAINQQLGNVAQQGVGYVQNALNSPLASPGQAVGSVPVTAAASNAGQIITDAGANRMANLTAQNNANQIQTSVNSPELLQQQVTDAIYRQQQQYLDPQFQQSQDALTSQLANQGITQGSQAYDTAMKNAALQRQQAYSNAQMNAIQGGVGAASTLFGNQLAAGQFGNQALGQQFGQGVTLNQLANQIAAQNNQTNLANAGFTNQALGQQFGQNQSAAEQAFQQQMQNAALQNAAMQQNFSNAQTLQNNPLNMLNAVRTGQQMQVAQTPAAYAPMAAQGYAGPDMLGAAQGTYNAQLAGVNAQNAANAGMFGGLVDLGVAGIGKFSDRRLKKNIVQIGVHALGIPLYAWEYFWGEKATGVMADELEKVMPEAVFEHPSGFKMVNYSMIGG